MEYAHPEDYFGSKLERERPITAQDFFNRKPDNHANF